MPIAMLRSRAIVKVMAMSARVAGIIVAAPTASRARAAISTSAVGASAASSEAPAKTASPIRNMRRWPTRSPRVPLPSSSPAITTG